MQRDGERLGVWGGGGVGAVVWLLYLDNSSTSKYSLIGRGREPCLVLSEIATVSAVKPCKCASHNLENVKRTEATQISTTFFVELHPFP